MDYNVNETRRSERAETKLLDKADYIYHDSQNEIIANNFLETIRSAAEKLSFVAMQTANSIFIL